MKKKKSLDKYFILAIGITVLVSVLIFPNKPSPQTNSYTDLKAQLFPSSGFNTQIILGDTVPKLVESGVIDMEKFRQIYGNLTDEQMQILTQLSNQPLVLTNENANFMLNILWPMGISNKNPILDDVAQYQGVANLASTGGWTLAKTDAMNYFDKLQLVNLTSDQQAIVEEVARNSYRPCCDNPTAFPDCNHGAALLALLELGASQGMNKTQLYLLALHANTLWFPQQYLSTAILYKMQGKDYWSSAQGIMGYNYSSGSGWYKNVYKPLQQQNLLPTTGGGGSCGV